MKGKKIFVKKDTKREYGRERYKNLPEYEKQRLMEYRKNILKSKKSASQ